VYFWTPNHNLQGSDMSDLEQVTTPEEPPQKQESKRGPLLIIGGIGCALLLCLGLMIGGSALFLILRSSSADETSPIIAETTTDEAVEAVEDEEVIPSETIEVTKEPQPSPTPSDTPNAVAGEVDTSLVSGTPEMSPITFAADTAANGEAIDPDFTFKEGITEIHAVFEYANLTSNNTWTQIWYHNGDEVLNTDQPWLEGESGDFDYAIEAGGEPLPAGEWAIEFYIDDELLTAGSFVVEAEDAASSEPIDLADLPKLYKIVYTKWNGEHNDLYIGDSNGSSEQFIMSRASGPSWSYDGRSIFFYGEEGVDQQVSQGVVYPYPGISNGIVQLSVSPIPGNVTQLKLTQGHGWNDGTARWASISPDGSMIAYDGDRGGGRRIYFLGTQANQQFRYEIIGEQADWSPDSQKIVYRSGRDNQFGIWISNRDDSGHTRITEGGTDSFPSWSPNGNTIAFSRDMGGNVDIYTVNIDGTNLQRLTSAPGHDTLPLYLPNGDIVFRSARSGSWEIWKMKGDGSDQIAIIPNAGVGPDWAFSKMGVLR